jgi:hypothetical protein
MAKNYAQIKLDNTALIDSIRMGGSCKEAAAGILNKSLTHEAYEQGIMRRIYEVENARVEEQAQQVDTLEPTYIREVKPGSVGAFSMPFAGVPSNGFMALPRYRITCRRIGSRRLTGDVLLLKGYNEDIKKLFSDMQLRDILFEEDSTGISKFDELCGDLNDGSTTTNIHARLTGAKGYIELGGPMSRSTIELLSQGLLSTDGTLDIATYLTNVVTAKQLIGMDHDQIGGPQAEQILFKGVGKLSLDGKDWITTIKKGLVKNGDVYAFAESDALGNFIVVEDVTMGLKMEDYNIESWCWECAGISVGGIGAVCKATFSGSTAGTWELS